VAARAPRAPHKHLRTHLLCSGRLHRCAMIPVSNTQETISATLDDRCARTTPAATHPSVSTGKDSDRRRRTTPRCVSTQTPLGISPTPPPPHGILYQPPAMPGVEQPYAALDADSTSAARYSHAYPLAPCTGHGSVRDPLQTRHQTERTRMARVDRPAPLGVPWGGVQASW
jgi:hypothetical protein